MPRSKKGSNCFGGTIIPEENSDNIYKMQKHYIYIVRCNDNSLYTGYAIDLKRREKEHNEGGGARYTRMRRPVKIVYFEEFRARSAATKREYQIKQLRKKDKEDLIILKKNID